MANSLIATDQNEPWWNQQWLLQEHVMQTPVISGATGQIAQTVGHVTNYPQVYSDHFPSQSTVLNAQVLAIPGGYRAAVAQQRRQGGY